MSAYGSEYKENKSLLVYLSLNKDMEAPFLVFKAEADFLSSVTLLTQELYVNTPKQAKLLFGIRAEKVPSIQDTDVFYKEKPQWKDVPILTTSLGKYIEISASVDSLDALIEKAKERAIDHYTELKKIDAKWGMNSSALMEIMSIDSVSVRATLLHQLVSLSMDGAREVEREYYDAKQEGTDKERLSYLSDIVGMTEDMFVDLARETKQTWIKPLGLN